MRTWLETGRGNFCLRCFIVVAGGLADDHGTRVAGVDCPAAELRDWHLE